MENEEGGRRAAEQQAGGKREAPDPAQAADLPVVEGLDLLHGSQAGVQLQFEGRRIGRLRGCLAEEFFYLVFHFSRYSLTCLRPRVR